MTDSELKRIILNKYYEKRSFRNVELNAIDFENTISNEEIVRISIYLIDDILLKAKIIYDEGGNPFLIGANITSKGISVVENQKIDEPKNQTFNINISKSKQFQIGNNNQLK